VTEGRMVDDESAGALSLRRRSAVPAPGTQNKTKHSFRLELIDADGREFRLGRRVAGPKASKRWDARPVYARETPFDDAAS